MQTSNHFPISERPDVMDVLFFEKVFELFYVQLSQLYSREELLSQKIVRVDSTMVAGTSAKLLEGMCVGCKKDGKKQTKVIILFYRKRWDIEVFFRLLKQELNLSHFFSTKASGIKIILT